MPITHHSKRISILSILLILAIGFTVATAAVQISGAIWTSDIAGQPVNQNHYDFKWDVYLNGGPNNGNPPGLPAGEYYFQVTNPSGSILLSVDPAECRRITVNSTGRFSGLSASVPAYCPQRVQNMAADFGTTVQLYPFYDTPNNGGVYKVWLISAADAQIDPDDDRYLIFSKSAAKTDNFKVVEQDPIID